MYPPEELLRTRRMPQPPRLHWAWVLVINIVTLGMFEGIWLCIQANWVRKVRGKSGALIWCILFACAMPVFFFGLVFVGALFGIMHIPLDEFTLRMISLVFRLIFIATRLASIYMLRDELSEEPISIDLGGIATFFFGATYFQYHLHDFVMGEHNEVAEGSLGLSAR